jgi:hypothetical protein
MTIKTESVKKNCFNRKLLGYCTADPDRADGTAVDALSYGSMVCEECAPANYAKRKADVCLPCGSSIIANEAKRAEWRQNE